MKNLLTIIFFWIASNIVQAQSGSDNSFLFRLKDNTDVRIEACTPRIFHVKKTDNIASASLMDRYGILKTDWLPIKTSYKEEGDNHIIITSELQLLINSNSGEFAVKDNSGKIIISNIQLFVKGDTLATKLGKSLEQYFGKTIQTGGIIGDLTHSVIKTDTGVDKNENIAGLLGISLSTDEYFYGAGSASRKHIQHRGSALKIWASYQKSEAPAPFLMSSHGWGIFNNTTAKNYFDVARFDSSRLFVYNPSGDIDFYLIVGKEMPEVLEMYTTITGKPYLLPKWAYGLAFGSNILENQFNVLDNALRFRKEQIPCDIYWLEPQWMKKNYDFSPQKNWDTEKFQSSYEWMNDPKDPKASNLYVHRMKNLGYKTALWLCVDHDLSIEEEDYISVKNGQPGSGREHWFQHLNKFVDQGVAGFKMDPGRTLDEHPDRKYFNGTTDAEMHNLNQVLIQKQMCQTFREHTGLRSFHHYCGGYAGSQHWGASTVGDNGGNVKSLYDVINQSFSGNSNIAIDMLEDVSFKGPGIHYAFFTPWVQLNSWAWMLHPWYYNDYDKNMFRDYAQLRYSLIPYIYSAAIKSSLTGRPIVWPMALAFPGDSMLTGTFREYMFGENLLVGAFTDSVYLPVGKWIDYWSGKIIEGKKFIHCQIPENKGGPLFIKAGAIIPYQKPVQYIGDRSPDTLIIRVYPEKHTTYTLLEDDGKTFEYENGKVAHTIFECNETSKRIDFFIHPVEGTYDDMPLFRTFLVEFNLSQKPKSVLINGKQGIGQYHNGKLQITLPRNAVNLKQTLTLLN